MKIELNMCYAKYRMSTGEQATVEKRKKIPSMEPSWGDGDKSRASRALWIGGTRRLVAKTCKHGNGVSL